MADKQVTGEVEGVDEPKAPRKPIVPASYGPYGGGDKVDQEYSDRNANRYEKDR